MELTLKQYAATLGISYEAARGSFNLHKDKDLIEGTHYRREGRQRILTAAGIAEMDKYRTHAKTQPPMIHPGDVAALQAKIEALEAQNATLQDQINERDAEADTLRKWIAEKDAQIDACHNAITQAQSKIIEVQNKLIETQQRLLTTAETKEKRPGIFARLFGKKERTEG